MCRISICGSGTTREEKLTFGYLVISVSEEKMDTRTITVDAIVTFSKSFLFFLFCS